MFKCSFFSRIGYLNYRFVKSEKWKPTLEVRGPNVLEGSRARQREKVSANTAVSINWL